MKKIARSAEAYSRHLQKGNPRAVTPTTIADFTQALARAALSLRTRILTAIDEGDSEGRIQWEGVGASFVALIRYFRTWRFDEVLREELKRSMGSRAPRFFEVFGGAARDIEKAADNPTGIPQGWIEKAKNALAKVRTDFVSMESSLSPYQVLGDVVDRFERQWPSPEPVGSPAEPPRQAARPAQAAAPATPAPPAATARPTGPHPIEERPEAPRDAFFIACENLAEAVGRPRNHVDRRTKEMMLATTKALRKAVEDLYRSVGRLPDDQARRARAKLDHLVIREFPRQIAAVTRLVEAGQAGKASGRLGDLIARVREFERKLDERPPVIGPDSLRAMARRLREERVPASAPPPRAAARPPAREPSFAPPTARPANYRPWWAKEPPPEPPGREIGATATSEPDDPIRYLNSNPLGPATNWMRDDDRFDDWGEVLDQVSAVEDSASTDKFGGLDDLQKVTEIVRRLAKALKDLEQVATALEQSQVDSVRSDLSDLSAALEEARTAPTAFLSEKAFQKAFEAVGWVEDLAQRSY